MKIAIPVENNTIESNICPSFGRTPYFMTYDTETKAVAFVDNTANASQGGAGIKAAQTIVDLKVAALLTPRCGENAAQVLQAANIILYKTQGSAINDNLVAFAEGKLNTLSEIHPGFHNHGGN